MLDQLEYVRTLVEIQEINSGSTTKNNDTVKQKLVVMKSDNNAAKISKGIITSKELLDKYKGVTPPQKERVNYQPNGTTRPPEIDPKDGYKLRPASAEAEETKIVSDANLDGEDQEKANIDMAAKDTKEGEAGLRQALDKDVTAQIEAQQKAQAAQAVTDA